MKIRFYFLLITLYFLASQVNAGSGSRHLFQSFKKCSFQFLPDSCRRYSTSNFSFHESPLSSIYSDPRSSVEGHITVWSGNHPTPYGKYISHLDRGGDIIWNPNIHLPGEPAGVHLDYFALFKFLDSVALFKKHSPQALWMQALGAMNLAVHELQTASQKEINKYNKQHVHDSRSFLSPFHSNTANSQIAALYAAGYRGLVLGAGVNVKYLISAVSNTHLENGRRLEHVKSLGNDLTVPHAELLSPGGLVFWIARDPRLAIHDVESVSISSLDVVRGAPVRVDGTVVPESLKANDDYNLRELQNPDYFDLGSSGQWLDFMRKFDRDPDQWDL